MHVSWDYVYSDSGWCVLCVGGNYNSNANYGLMCFNALNDSSNSNDNIGARLLVSSYTKRWLSPHHLVKILPCKKTFLRLARACRKARKRQTEHRHISGKLARSILSRAGQLKHCNSHTIRETYIDPIGIKNLKEVVRHESQRRQRAA